jgi:arsenite methyltransferase
MEILINTPAGETASSCCSTAEQEACCNPAEKAACCGTAPDAGGGCGCQ